MNRLRHQVQYKLNNNLRINYKYMKKRNRYIVMNKRTTTSDRAIIFILENLDDFFEYIINISLNELDEFETKPKN